MIVSAGSIPALGLLHSAPSPRTIAAQAAQIPAAALGPSASAAQAAWRSLGTPAAGAAGNSCQPVPDPAGYVNPLAGAHVIGERLDQGVDYAGTGTLGALGAGRITTVATEGSGWPGAFIEYQLTAGADRGCFVYYAEGVAPVPGLHVGQTVTAGQPVATLIAGWSTGIEIGWGGGGHMQTYAAKTHQWSAKSDADSVPSAPAKVFSALITALGAPPGKVEG